MVSLAKDHGLCLCNNIPSVKYKKKHKIVPVKYKKKGHVQESYAVNFSIKIQ